MADQTTETIIENPTLAMYTRPYKDGPSTLFQMKRSMKFMDALLPTPVKWDFYEETETSTNAFLRFSEDFLYGRVQGIVFYDAQCVSDRVADKMMQGDIPTFIVSDWIGRVVAVSAMATLSEGPSFSSRFKSLRTRQIADMAEQLGLPREMALSPYHKLRMFAQEAM